MKRWVICPVEVHSWRICLATAVLAASPVDAFVDFFAAAVRLVCFGSFVAEVVFPCPPVLMWRRCRAWVPACDVVVVVVVVDE